ncbi:MAG TPA: NnrU family protein [Vitreimonas sp.]|uniref:NnrU family protein n=1 Tax=Vitreimonas sp. TaxID=3069702 RepID=UPI002D266505|nr:NnrU family protein [Vitreimonas sp.]HYD88242.1 NnrU family protein [Vitreimonas sp.]
MSGFAWALALFVLIHVGVSATGLRGQLVRRIGEGPYRALFALVSLALLVWLIQGYAAMRADPFDPLNEALWAPPSWLRWPAYVLTFLGVSLAIAGVLTPGPTYAGFETRSLKRAEPAHGVLRITRHPFLWGVALWAAGHLLVNGERSAVMLFGVLGLMVIFGARSIDRKARARDAAGWSAFEEATSNVPFMAITQGRNRLALGEIGWRGLAGIAAAVLLALGHEPAIGVAAF